MHLPGDREEEWQRVALARAHCMAGRVMGFHNMAGTVNHSHVPPSSLLLSRVRTWKQGIPVLCIGGNPRFGTRTCQTFITNTVDMP